MPGQQLMGWQDIQIAKQLASGERPSVIADEWDISPQTISNIRKRQRELIETESARYLESLPDCVGIQKKLIKSVQDDLEANPHEVDSDGVEILDGDGTPRKRERLDRTNPELFKAGCKAADNVMKSVGLHPSQSISINIQKIYNDHSQTIIAPVVLDLLADLNAPADDDE